MEKGQSSRNNIKGKKVLLDLDKEIKERTGRALVGRIETDRVMNRNTVVSMRKKGWGLNTEVEIHNLVDTNVFLFRFKNIEDYRRVLKGRPWSIQGNLLNIQHWDDYMVFNEVNFRWCPFWVQFHGLPHIAFNKESVTKMGEAIGKVVLIENPVLNDRLTRTFMRARVLVDLTQPFTTVFWVPRPKRDPAWANVKYEQLQNFSYDWKNRA